MASKVNTKFVILLVAGLAAVCLGLVGLAVYNKMRSGERLIVKGDALLAAGQYKEAALEYSRGVNKDQSRIDWMQKWLDALKKTTPGTQAEYNDAYSRQYLNILGKMAVLRPNEPQFQLTLVEELDKRFRLMPGRVSVQTVQGQIQTISDRLERLKDRLDDPITKKIIGIRGVAELQEMRMFPVDEAKRDQALSDLRTGVTVTPEDPRFQLAIVDWYETEIDRLVRRENRPELAEDLRADLAKARATLVENFGDRPEVIVHEFNSDAENAIREARTPEAAVKIQQSLYEPAAALLVRLESLPIDAFSVESFLDAATAVARYSDPESKEQKAALASWAETFLAAHPDDPRTIIATARLQRSAGEYARSFQLFDQCVSLKDVPVSLEGVVLPSYRRMAAGERVDTALLQREISTDPAEKAKFLEVAKAQRDALKPLIDVGTEWELTLREARLAMVEEKYRKAIGLFEDLRSQGQADNPSILLPLADALTRSGSEGMAKTIYERLLGNGEESVAVYSRLAEIELGMGNVPRATDLYERAARLEPGNQFVQSRLSSIRSVSQDPTTAGASDPNGANPIVSLVLKARRARQEGNLVMARSLLREALDQAPSDARIVREAVGVELADSNRPAALQLVDEALVLEPDNQSLKTLKTQVEIEDPMEAALQIIADSSDPPVVKALSRYVVYMQNQKPDEAETAFQEAEKADPQNPGVIEVGFNRALKSGPSDGFAKAAEYADRAARLDIDQRGGLTFQGRLELNKGDREAAEQTLKRAVEKMEFDPSSWRWLGQAQRLNGRVDQAVASYERAYVGDPKDIAIAAEYADLLRSVGQGAKALSLLSPETGVLRFDQRNKPLVSMWLEYEAAYGDRAKAVETRKKLFDSAPEDVANARQYFTLLVADKQFDEAMRVIEAMESVPEVTPLEIVSGKARILAAQGKTDEARTLMKEYVASIPADKRTYEPYMALGAFEREYGGTPEDALAAFEAGAPYQDPKRREMDRSAGDLLFSLGDRENAKTNVLRAEDKSEELAAVQAAARGYFERAEQKYREIAKADPTDAGVQKRLAETLIRMEKYDDAYALLRTLGEADTQDKTAKKEDLQVLLLRETIATRKGDMRAAREILDNAVASYPNDPTPFFRRAVLNRTDPTRAQDVAQDLDQAVKLRPGFIEAWQLRVAILADQGRRDEAVAQLGLAVKANPSSDELILYYIKVLRGIGRLDEAKKVAMDVADTRETDVDWLRRAGILAYDNEDYQQAEAIYKRIYDLDPGQGPAMDLLNSYLRRENPPPTRAEVNRILPMITDESDLTPGGMMLMARAREFLDERAEAEKWTVKAFEKAKANPVDMRLWFENVVLRFKKDREKAFDYVLSKKEFQPLPPAIRLLTLRREVANGRDMASGLEALNAMEGECVANGYTHVEFLRLRNMFHYSLSQYDKAVEDCREGLKIIPRDLEFNNNLAYILAKHLDDAEAAVAPAEIAVAVAPSDPAVLDTLGWVYFKVNRFRDADAIFARSIQTSRTPDDFVPTYLHQAQSKQAIKDLDEARRFIRLAKENLDKSSQTIKEQYTDEIESLLKELNESN